MSIDEIKKLLRTEQYNFLRTNEHLGSNIMLLTLGGSYAYGTNIETSDIDIRGIATNTSREILLGRCFEQVCNSETDTTIYSLSKMIELLAQCNPNTIEILGCKPEHYIYVNDIGQSLLDNKDMFLSQRALNTFMGYANQQLRRLENLSVRNIEQERQEVHMLKTIEHARTSILEHYNDFHEGKLKLYIDEAVTEGYDAEIFVDIDELKHYPLRDYNGILNEMNSIIRSYNKLGKRNENALTHNKIGKHSMHLIRLYMMCIDILEKGEINTYREKEHDLLMRIRNNEFLNEDGVPNKEFYEMVDEYERKVTEAAKNTSLPEKPDRERIDEWLLEVNKKICLDSTKL